MCVHDFILYVVFNWHKCKIHIIGIAKYTKIFFLVSTLRSDQSILVCENRKWEKSHKDLHFFVYIHQSLINCKANVKICKKKKKNYNQMLCIFTMRVECVDFNIFNVHFTCWWIIAEKKLLRLRFLPWIMRLWNEMKQIEKIFLFKVFY